VGGDFRFSQFPRLHHAKRPTIKLNTQLTPTVYFKLDAGQKQADSSAIFEAFVRQVCGVRLRSSRAVWRESCVSKMNEPQTNERTNDRTNERTNAACRTSASRGSNRSSTVSGTVALLILVTRHSHKFTASPQSCHLTS